MAAQVRDVAAHPFLAWLRGEGRLIEDREAFVAALAQKLLHAGVPVARITTAVPVLHPNVDTSAIYWQVEEGAEERTWQMTPEAMKMRQNSPLHIAYFDGLGSRCRIGAQAEAGEFSILPDLRAAGMTDYLALPAPFSDGTTKAITFATKAPDGFSDANIALLEAMMPMAAMILEIQTLRRTALTLLDTYVGPAAGRRVVEGSIKRGMGETIHSVIWFCDLRGFTELSGRLDDEALLALLNDYFGAMTDAVQSHGGEVLKFIGDAMLAIFALDADAERAETAARALAAAAAARAALAAVNETRVASGAPPIRCGIALHVGDVHYGNIGGAGRLDFTVIGPAVNLASRVESLCGELGENLLLSADFVAESGIASRPVGSFALKGIAAEQTVYVPDGPIAAPDQAPG